MSSKSFFADDDADQANKLAKKAKESPFMLIGKSRGSWPQHTYTDMRDSNFEITFALAFTGEFVCKYVCSPIHVHMYVFLNATTVK